MKPEPFTSMQRHHRRHPLLKGTVNNKIPDWCIAAISGLSDARAETLRGRQNKTHVS